MSDPESKPDQQSSTDAPPPQPNSTATYTSWPPNKRTRKAIVNRLIDTFTTSSVLSNTYGTLSADEASVAARQIEDEAFSFADASSSSDNDTNKFIFEVYSKRIGKSMLETVKARFHLADEGNAAAVTASPAADAVAAVSDS